MISIFFSTPKRASTTHSMQLSADGVICFLEIDEAPVQRDSLSSSEFLQSAHDEQHAHC